MAWHLDPKVAARIKKMIAEGRGQGRGINFKPWLTVRQVCSIGKSSRILGWLIRRVYHMFSDAETKYFYLLQWSKKIKDIREQFPCLPIESTLEIADRLCIRHPGNKGEPVVVTTDFVIDIATDEGIKTIARSVKKSPSALESGRTIEKLEIERTYWSERGVDWGIVTEDDMPLTLARNIAIVYEYLDLSDFPITIKKKLPQIERLLHKIIANSVRPLADDCLTADEHLGLGPGSCLTIVKHFIASGKWEINMEVPFDTAKPLSLLRANVKALRKAV